MALTDEQYDESAKNYAEYLLRVEVPEGKTVEELQQEMEQAAASHALWSSAPRSYVVEGYGLAITQVQQQ